MCDVPEKREMSSAQSWSASACASFMSKSPGGASEAYGDDSDFEDDFEEDESDELSGTIGGNTTLDRIEALATPKDAPPPPRSAISFITTAAEAKLSWRRRRRMVLRSWGAPR